MKAGAMLVVMLMTLIAVDPSEIVGKWRFSKLDDGDGTVLDLESSGIGAEWTFFADGRLVSHAEDRQGRWSLKKKTLTVEFPQPNPDIKQWTIKSINSQEMVFRRKLASGKTSTVHLKRLESD